MDILTNDFIKKRMIHLQNTGIDTFDTLVRQKKELTNSLIDYWKDYSDFSTWQFWLIVAMFLVPLIILYFKIDKNKIFLIGFYGYSIHMAFAYIDISGINLGFWNYPYKLIPALPSFSLDSSLVPVTFMLVYQWTLNHKKNFYIYSTIAAIIFAFIFKPILASANLFRMYDGTNFFHLFLIYVFVFLIAKFLTNLFLKLHKS